MKISVMFITYNRKKELLRAIESCIKRRMDPMEIVIVDNHSHDGTQIEAECLLKENQMPFQYFYSEENLGVSEGRNVAFAMCKGEYVFCLDDDAIVETNGFFEKIYQRMKSGSDVVAAAVEIYEPESDRYLKGCTYKRKGETYALSYIGAAHVLKKDTFKGRKLYPSKVRFGSEESYIAYRIRAMKKKMLYLDSVRVLHLPSTIGRVYGEDRKLNIIINNHVIRNLCYPKIVLPLLYLTLRNRIWRHRFLKTRTYSEIKEMIAERYDPAEVNRMSLAVFLNMLKDAGLKWVL